MLQQFHEIKSNQENDMMHSNSGESRSSTPSSVLDRVMFSSNASPLPLSQHSAITSYTTSSPPVITASPTAYYGTKYLASTPPDAHRYHSETFRVSPDVVDQGRYIPVLDPNRISLDPYRQLQEENLSRTINSDIERIRVEDQIGETYHRPVETSYSPVDLHRVPETNSQQLITAQRLVSELQRMQASSDQLQRLTIPIDSISPTDSTDYRSSTLDSVRPPSEPIFRVAQESMLRTHSDPQRLVQESFKEFFPPESPKPSVDILRPPSLDHRLSIDNDRYLDNVRENTQRFDNGTLSIQRGINSGRMSSHEIPSEDLRSSSQTPHTGMTENLRLENDIMHGLIHDDLRMVVVNSSQNLRNGTNVSSSIMPENPRLRMSQSHSMVIENHRGETDPHHHILIPENLRVSNAEMSHSIDILRGETTDTGVLSENLIVSDDGSHHTLLPGNMRVGAETPHRLLGENLRVDARTPHSVAPEDLCIGSETSHDGSSSVMVENFRIGGSNINASLQSLIANHNHLRFGSENSRNSLVENLRLITPEHGGLISENIRNNSEISRMVPENLCLSEPPPQVLPENLRVNSINGSLGNSINHQGGSRMISHHDDTANMSLMRTHYDVSSHRNMINNNSHPLRVQSPNYSEVYRNDNQDSLPTETPAHMMGDQVAGGSSTHTPQFYSNFSSLPSNHYADYMNEDCSDERDLRMSLEEKINRGYHDIKPFDQNYPISMPLMHMPCQDIPVAAAPPQPVAKPPKPKKPKEPKPPRLPIIHKCNECLRVFKNSTQLKNHMWRHTGEKPFTCDECGSKFTQQGNLRAHRRIHTGERPYECTDCKTCFTQLSTLKTHQKIHSNERPYHCSQCDAAFRQIANLKTHQVTHTGERPHQCDLCDKAFTQKSNLKAHKNRVHTRDGRTTPAKRGRKKNPVAIKPFVCVDCGAKFTMISNLKIHSRLHTKDNTKKTKKSPFRCEDCGAEFAQRSNLKTHALRMHGKVGTATGGYRRRIRCDECPAMFRLKRCLKTHKKRRHPIKSLKIKILRESKYLMNSVGASRHDEEEGDDDDDGDEEENDYELEDDEDDDSETEVLESPLLTKKFKVETSDVSKTTLVETKEEEYSDELYPVRENDEENSTSSSKENEVERWEGKIKIKEEQLEGINSPSEVEAKGLSILSSSSSS